MKMKKVYIYSDDKMHKFSSQFLGEHSKLDEAIKKECDEQERKNARDLEQNG